MGAGWRVWPGPAFLRLAQGHTIYENTPFSGLPTVIDKRFAGVGRAHGVAALGALGSTFGMCSHVETCVVRLHEACKLISSNTSYGPVLGRPNSPGLEMNTRPNPSSIAAREHSSPPHPHPHPPKKKKSAGGRLVR